MLTFAQTKISSSEICEYTSLTNLAAAYVTRLWVMEQSQTKQVNACSRAEIKKKGKVMLASVSVLLEDPQEQVL